MERSKSSRGVAILAYACRLLLLFLLLYAASFYAFMWNGIGYGREHFGPGYPVYYYFPPTSEFNVKAHNFCRWAYHPMERVHLALVGPPYPVHPL